MRESKLGARAPRWSLVARRLIATTVCCLSYAVSAQAQAVVSCGDVLVYDDNTGQQTALQAVTNLGVPYILRAVLLGLTLVTAFLMMKDLGFTPERGAGPIKEVRRIVRGSIDNGWRKRPSAG